MMLNKKKILILAILLNCSVLLMYAQASNSFDDKFPLNFRVGTTINHLIGDTTTPDYTFLPLNGGYAEASFTVDIMKFVKSEIGMTAFTKGFSFQEYKDDLYTEDGGNIVTNTYIGWVVRIKFDVHSSIQPCVGVTAGSLISQNKPDFAGDIISDSNHGTIFLGLDVGNFTPKGFGAGAEYHYSPNSKAIKFDGYDKGLSFGSLVFTFRYTF